jgi:hypothetical protein
MPANAFDVFMARHAPVGTLVAHANEVLWERSALHPVAKERMRIALAEAIGCAYCARFRTELDGTTVLDDATRGAVARQADVAERFAVAVARGDFSDELTVEVQAELSPAEFTDLVFSAGWFIGMQHVGKVMHWDDNCPVAAVRALVEAGEAA